MGAPSAPESSDMVGSAKLCFVECDSDCGIREAFLLVMIANGILMLQFKLEQLDADKIFDGRSARASLKSQDWPVRNVKEYK